MQNAFFSIPSCPAYPLEDIAHGREEAGVGEVKPQHVGQVGGQLLVQRVVPPVGGRVAQNNAPHRQRGEDGSPWYGHVLPASWAI